MELKDAGISRGFRPSRHPIAWVRTARSRTSWQEPQGILTLPSPMRGCAQTGRGRERTFVGASGRGPACNAVATGRLSGASPLSPHKHKPYNSTEVSLASLVAHW